MEMGDVNLAECYMDKHFWYHISSSLFYRGRSRDTTVPKVIPYINDRTIAETFILFTDERTCTPREPIIFAECYSSFLDTHVKYYCYTLLIQLDAFPEAID